ncbi:hypothetical protein [Flavobacterium ovatum]|uniref:hypothetical protein n=1 Tax=Flavobacterium ovatum TaxID=1928857 RepID=UPI00344B8E39
MKEKIKEKQNKNFVMVKNDLMASTELSSTQKLFVSYILGWQKNNLICKETNSNLASRFGMKYGGIRSVIRELNKHDFFKAESYDYDKRTSTSGHEIKVNETKLLNFLTLELANSHSTEDKKEEESISILPEDLVAKLEESEVESLPKYSISDTVNLYEVLLQLKFNQDDMLKIKEHFKSETIIFDLFVDYFIELEIGQKFQNYKGIKVSDEQIDLFHNMIST